MAIGLVMFVSGAVCAATTQDPGPPAPEILRALSLHSGERLVNVVERRSYEYESGAWYVRADTAATISGVNGMCERTRIVAVIVRSGRNDESWSVLEAERATVVAVQPSSPRTCKALPAKAFFALSDTAKLGDVEMLMYTVKQMRTCARKSEDCAIRVTATPWGILDKLADAPVPPTVLSVDLDPNFSTDSLSTYSVQFSIDDSEKVYNAEVVIADGRVKNVNVLQVVR